MTEATQERPTLTRTALVIKGDMLGAVGVTFGGANYVTTHDPREPHAVRQDFGSDGVEAVTQFGRALGATEANGWRVFYRGEPLIG